MAEAFSNKITRTTGIVSTSTDGACGVTTTWITGISTVGVGISHIVDNQHFRAGTKINSIGIGFTNYKNEGCKGNADSGEYTYCENTLTEKPYQIGEVNVISILYNFGNNLFFTVGGDLYASGYLITLDGESGNETVMKNPQPLFLFQTTLQFGLKFSKLELLVEYRDSFIEFKRPDSGHDTIETSGTILFGLGLIF